MRMPQMLESGNPTFGALYGFVRNRKRQGVKIMDRAYIDSILQVILESNMVEQHIRAVDLKA